MLCMYCLRAKSNCAKGRCLSAGASLVELYTGLVYEGPSLLRRMKKELTALLQRDGFASVHDAIGADHAIPRR